MSTRECWVITTSRRTRMTPARRFSGITLSATRGSWCMGGCLRWQIRPAWGTCGRETKSQLAQSRGASISSISQKYDAGSSLRLKLSPYLHKDFVIPPGGPRTRLLMVVRLQDQIAGGEQDLFDLRILVDLRAGGLDDEPIMLTRHERFIFHASALETDPGDAHLFHVLLRELSGVIGFKAGQL